MDEKCLTKETINKTEEELFKAIDDIIRQFYDKTGFYIESIDCQFVINELVGYQASEFILSKVKIAVDV